MEHAHQPCPFCDSSDGLSYNSGSGIFKCFVCDARPSTKRVKIFALDDIRPLGENNDSMPEGIVLEPYFRAYRGIRQETMEKCNAYFTKRPIEDQISFLEGLGSKAKESDLQYYRELKESGTRTLETVHYDYPNGTKHRELPKRITANGKVDRFWGQEDYNGGKVITITEGEEDRLSVIEIMGDWPVVSAPNANPSKDFWQSARDYLRNFEKIVLSVDNDDAGNKLAEKIYRMFPGKTYRVNHGGYKDANDFLWDKESGTARDERQLYKNAWWNAQRVKPDGILSTKEDFLKLYDETPDYEFFPTGIEELDRMMLGIHKGAFTTILAPTGCGKTEFMRYLEWQCISQTSYSVACCHGEETQLRSVLGLSCYALGDNVTRKDLIQEKGLEEAVKETFGTITTSEQFYQFQIKTDDGVDEIVDKVRFLATGMGADFVFIEPIQDFISGSTSEKESLLTDLTNKLKRLAPEINVGIVVIAHVNVDGEAKYCKSISQGAAYEIVLHRDREAEDPQERNRTYVSVGKKNRTGGGSGPAGALDFDVDTYTLSPVLGPAEPPTPKAKPKSEPKKTEQQTEEDVFDSIPF